MKIPLTPVRLRGMLVVALFLITAMSIGLFVFGYRQLNSVAEETLQTTANAEMSSNELQTLSTLKSRLDSQKDDVNRAAKIVSATKNYTYQDQIIKDLNTYAEASGVKITTIDFTENGQTGASSSGKKTQSTAAKVPTGTKSITATISLDSPVSYSNLYAFIYRIEQNLFQMQIKNLDLSVTSKENGARGLAANSLTVTAYVR